MKKPIRRAAVSALFICSLISFNPAFSLCAQTAFSANTLGYIDATFVAGSNLIANPLFSCDNTVSNLFAKVPDGTKFFACNHGSATFSSNHFSAQGGWSSPGDVFMAPNCGFLVLPSATTVTFIGQPWRTMPGPACLSYSGFEFYSGWFPTNVCGICEGGSCPPWQDGTTVYLWNRQTQAFDGGHQWIDGFGWLPSVPVVGATDGLLFFSGSFSARGPFGTLGSTVTPDKLPWIGLKSAQRTGTNLMVRFPVSSNVNYAVYRATNLNQHRWQQIAQGTAVPASGTAAVTVADTNSHGFYRVLPQFGSSIMFLGTGVRGVGNFGFDFYAPIATNYVVQRKASLSLPASSWQTVTTVSGGPSNLVHVVDAGASGATAYYRIYY